MAHGLPDYYRGVDIAYQALAEMIVRPKYGACQLASGQVTANALAETDLVTVSGKGLIYGGMIHADAASTQINSTPKVYIDGVAIFDTTFYLQDQWNYDAFYIRPCFLQKYDHANFFYETGLAYGLTFETAVKLAYVEAHGATPTVRYKLYYATI